MSIAPGQTKAINIGFSIGENSETIQAQLFFTYLWRGSTTIVNSDSFAFQGIERELSEPHKMVFKRPNETISYAVVNPPQPTKIVHCDRNETLPVFAVLHGAGVEAESQQTRDMLKEMGDITAWVIIPTGGTIWSGDDWRW